MAETWRYRGQEIGSQQITLLREFIRAHPTSSRWKLSRQLCEALGWKQANGALRDVVCRGLLLMLERAGQIELPPGPEGTPPSDPRAMPDGASPARGGPARHHAAGHAAFGFAPGGDPTCAAHRRSVAVQQPDGAPPLPGLRAAGRRASQISFVGPGAADCLSGLEFGAAAPGQPRPLHRLECGSPAAQHPLSGLQQSLPDSALGGGAALGLAHSQPHRPAAVAGLGARLWAPDLFSGDLRGSGTVSRDLLPGGELGAAGAHHGTRQGRPDAPAEPVD